MFDFIVRIGLVTSLGFLLSTKIDGDEQFAFFLCIAIILFSWFTPKKRELRVKSLGVLLLYVLITVIPLTYFKPVRFSFLNLLLGVLAMKAIGERCSISFRTTGYFLFAFAVGANLFLCLQLLGLDPIYQPVYGEPAGLSLVPWMMGVSACLALPFLFSIHPLLTLILLPMLYYSRSLACVAIAVLSFLMLHKTNWKLFFLLTAAGVFYLWAQDDLPKPDRLEVWKNSLSYLQNYPTGNGLGTWAHMGFVKLREGTWYHERWSHNEFFQIFWELGLTGGLLFLTWFVSVFLHVSARRSRLVLVSLFALAALCLVHPVFHFGRLAIFGLYILALGLANQAEQPQYEGRGFPNRPWLLEF